jgi:hypothetical protein
MTSSGAISTNSGVFISYARSDGADHAARLRRRLEKEHPLIKLWQDVISLHPGKGWWLQITDALEHVAYMVLVATPKCPRRFSNYSFGDSSTHLALGRKNRDCLASPALAQHPADSRNIFP